MIAFNEYFEEQAESFEHFLLKVNLDLMYKVMEIMEEKSPEAFIIPNVDPSCWLLDE